MDHRSRGRGNHRGSKPWLFQEDSRHFFQLDSATFDPRAQVSWIGLRCSGIQGSHTGGF